MKLEALISQASAYSSTQQPCVVAIKFFFSGAVVNVQLCDPYKRTFSVTHSCPTIVFFVGQERVTYPLRMSVGGGGAVATEALKKRRL